MKIKMFPGPPPIRGDATQMPTCERARCRAAAGHARRIYPGPLGELVFRELSAYAEFGYRLDGDGLIPRLATAVLAVRADAHPRSGGGALAAEAERDPHRVPLTGSTAL